MVADRGHVNQELGDRFDRFPPLHCPGDAVRDQAADGSAADQGVFLHASYAAFVWDVPLVPLQIEEIKRLLTTSIIKTEDGVLKKYAVMVCFSFLVNKSMCEKLSN